MMVLRHFCHKRLGPSRTELSSDRKLPLISYYTTYSRIFSFLLSGTNFMRFIYDLHERNCLIRLLIIAVFSCTLHFQIMSRFVTRGKPFYPVFSQSPRTYPQISEHFTHSTISPSSFLSTLCNNPFTKNILLLNSPQPQHPHSVPSQ